MRNTSPRKVNKDNGSTQRHNQDEHDQCGEEVLFPDVEDGGHDRLCFGMENAMKSGRERENDIGKDGEQVTGVAVD